MRDILLISYVFPPYFGIGGRRWAKHAVSLTKLGYRIHVICARNPFREQSYWTDEVKANRDIIRYELPALFPRVLLQAGHGFSGKLRYKFWTILLRRLVKGTIYDRAVFWRRPMLKMASGIIRRNKISHVICSGAPFGNMYYSTELKQRFPAITLLNDLRDPWTWGPNWGFSALSERRMAYELSRERKTIEGSDIVTMPSEQMRQHLASKYPEHAAKLKVLPHVYDPAEIPLARKTRSDRMRLVFYGTVYEGIDHYLKQLAQVLAANTQELELHMFTQDRRSEQIFLQAGCSNVHYFKALSSKQLFQHFPNYDYVLLINPDYNIENLSTKFFEIIYSRTPIFIVSKPGKGSGYIVTNKLGIHATFEEIQDKLRFEVLHEFTHTYNTGFDVSNYSVDIVTKNIERMLLQNSSD